MKKNILELSINYWNELFIGISAIDIAYKLNISHKKALSLVEELAAEKKGTLNKSVILYLISFDLNIDSNNRKLLETKSVTTHIFFPAKEILEQYYKENLLQFIKNGEYTNKLHRGNKQMDLIFFDVIVLSKYLNNKEKYSIEDDVIGGVLSLNYDFKLDIHEDEPDKVWFDKVWYGKRRLSSGNISVSAILKNLAKLPLLEQKYWSGFEIGNPSFTDYDDDFSRFVSRAYYGNWTDSRDPIQEIIKLLDDINKVFKFKIFNKLENAYLRYPINNTYKDFVDCNSELFKLIGPDNIELSNIKKIYLEYCKGTSEKLMNKDSGRPLSMLQIFELILIEVNNDLALAFKKHWETVKQNRIAGDHKITQPVQQNENYIDSFRKICNVTLGILKEINNEFKKFQHAESTT